MKMKNKCLQREGVTSRHYYLKILKPQPFLNTNESKMSTRSRFVELVSRFILEVQIMCKLVYVNFASFPIGKRDTTKWMLGSQQPINASGITSFGDNFKWMVQVMYSVQVEPS